MSDMLWLDTWLFRTALAGGSILLLGLIWMLFTRQPAQRQRIGEFSLCSGLLVAVLAALPGWWSCRLDFTEQPSLAVEPKQQGKTTLLQKVELPAVQALAVPAHDADQLDFEEMPLDEWWAEPGPREVTGIFWLMMNPWESSNSRLAVGRNPDGQPTSSAPPESSISLQPSSDADGSAAPLVTDLAPFPWPVFLAWVYFIIMGFLLGRCLLGYLGLWRLAQSAEPAPDHALALLNKLTSGWKHKPSLGVVPRLHGPISFGLWRPTILLPPKFCHAGDQSALRALLVHELTHLERRDAWSCLLLAVSQAVYFYLPWFWWLRRQIHLAQEYIADATAACWSSAVDYAQYLVSWSTWTARPTLAGSRANGVFQRTSELYRRVDMLLKNPVKVEAACSRRWTFAAAASFLAVATLAAGVRVQADEQDTRKAVVIVSDKDDDQDSKKTKFKVHDVRVMPTDDNDDAKGKHQRIQIVILGEDGETKLAEVPVGVKKIMLHPSKENGKPQRVEVFLVDESKSHKGDKKSVLLSGKAMPVMGHVKAHAVWQGHKVGDHQHEGQNVIRIIAVDGEEAKGKLVLPHKIQVIGMDGKEGKHEVRLMPKIVHGVASSKGEKVDVIIVDEKGQVQKKEVIRDVLKQAKPGSEGQGAKTMYFRLVEDKETGQHWKLDQGAKSALRLRVDGKDGNKSFVMPAMPSLPSKSFSMAPMKPMAPMPPMQGLPAMPPMKTMPGLSGSVTPTLGTFYLQNDENTKEHLERINKALEELEKALEKGGDRIPAEARKQLMEARTQLQAVRSKLQGRPRVIPSRPSRPTEPVRPTEEKAKDMDDSAKRREQDEKNRDVEQLKRLAEAQRQQAEAHRHQAENMARLAKQREEQARMMAQMHEEQARRAQAEAHKARDEAERSIAEARKLAEMAKRTQDQDRAKDEFRRKAEETLKKAQEERRARNQEGDGNRRREGMEALRKAQEELEKRKAQMEKERKDRDGEDKRRDGDNDAQRKAQAERERAQRERERAMQERDRERERRLEQQRKEREDARNRDEANRQRTQERGAGEGQRGAQLGVQIEAINPDVAAQLDLPADKHVIIRQVVPGSAAEKAGMKNHDILLSFAGKEISQPGDLVKIISEGRFDRGVEAVILRKGKKMTLRNIDLGTPARRASSGSSAAPGSGASRGAESRKDAPATSNSFTIIGNDDEVRITIKGKLVDGRMTAESITIKDGDNEDIYDTLRRVPAKHRAKVQKLLDQSSKTAP